MPVVASGGGLVGDGSVGAPLRIGSVRWDQLALIPAGFADGVDDVGLMSAAVTAPLSGNGTAGSPLSIARASVAIDGYLAAADFASFTSKVSPTDPRLTDARAPLPGSASYIQNQSAAPQSASFSITGGGRFGGDVVVDAAGAVRASGDVFSYGASVSRLFNVRSIITKTSANSFCPSGSTAVYTPRSYVGRSGAQICAADTRLRLNCVAVRFAYITVANSFGPYGPNDVPCSQPLSNPWPWGIDLAAPNSFDPEWGSGDTRIVCCQ